MQSDLIAILPFFGAPNRAGGSAPVKHSPFDLQPHVITAWFGGRLRRNRRRAVKGDSFTSEPSTYGEKTRDQTGVETWIKLGCAFTPSTLPSGNLTKLLNMVIYSEFSNENGGSFHRNMLVVGLPEDQPSCSHCFPVFFLGISHIPLPKKMPLSLREGQPRFAMP